MTGPTACGRVTEWPPRPASTPVDVHLRVEVDATGRFPACAERADVLCLRAPEQPTELASEAVRGLLDRFPGCLVAVAPATGGCVAGARDGTRVVAAPAAEDQRSMTALERAGLASFLHGRLVAKRSWVGPRGEAVLLMVAVRATGGRQLRLRIRSLADHLSE